MDSSLRQAAQQALEFCEFLWREVVLNDWAEGQREATEAALRAALVEDAMQKFTDVNQELEAALAEPVQEPVAVVRSVVGQGDDGVRIKWFSGFPQIGDRLYTAPPQRKPLVDPAEYDDFGAAERYNRGLK